MPNQSLRLRGRLEVEREPLELGEAVLVDEARALLGEHHLDRGAHLDHVAHEPRVDRLDHRAAMRIDVEHAFGLERLQRDAHWHVAHVAQRRDVVDLEARARLQLAAQDALAKVRRHFHGRGQVGGDRAWRRIVSRI